MWIDDVKEWMDRDRPFVLATVIRSEGSTPRGMGTRMLIACDGDICGTVGGGDVEHIIVKHAREVLRKNKTEILTFSLAGDTWTVMEGVEIQSLCGGRLDILMEPMTRGMEVVAFGGGHIARKLAGLCDVMEISYRIYDNREAFASKTRFPTAAETVCASYEELKDRIVLTESSYCVILTHGHAFDHVVLEALMAQKHIPYIGMIGSRHKIGAIIGKIEKSGITPDNRLYSPVGLNIGWSKPQEIALAILAEIRVLDSGGSPEHCRLNWAKDEKGIRPVESTVETL